MASQFSDGFRVFPVNNTFLSHAISTLNESHWQLLLLFPFQNSCHSNSFLFLGHHETSNIFNMSHRVAQKLYIKSPRSSELKDLTRTGYHVYLTREICVKVLGDPWVLDFKIVTTIKFRTPVTKGSEIEG